MGAAQQERKPVRSGRCLLGLVRLIASVRLLSVRLRASSKPPKSGSGSGSGPASALFGFFFLALSTGANMTLPNAFWAEFYGTAHLGSIKAMAAAVMVLGSALGPGLTGVLIDAGVGIEAQYMGVAGYFVFASAMMAIGVTQARPGLSVAV